MKRFLLILAALAFALPAFAQDNTIGSRTIHTFAGPPVAGVSEVQTITIGGTPTGGTFAITPFEPSVQTTLAPVATRATAPIAWSATNATLVANIQAALAATNAVGPGGCTVAVGTATAGIGTFTITFTGKLGMLAVPVYTANAAALTGASPTVAIAITTPGVTPTFRTAAPGEILVDKVTPGLYFNSSASLLNPVWTQK